MYEVVVAVHWALAAHVSQGGPGRALALRATLRLQHGDAVQSAVQLQLSLLISYERRA
jgi:hypothetical protein